MSHVPHSYTGACKRCKGAKQITAEDDPDMIFSCPDCEGTGEELDDDAEDGEDTNVEDSNGR